MLTHPLWGADSCPPKGYWKVGHRRKGGETSNDSVNDTRSSLAREGGVCLGASLWFRPEKGGFLASI